jgi:ribosomal protein S18 acetylase RimI-like enzyme
MSELKTVVYNEENKPSKQDKKDIVDFLYTHLEEFGDPKEHIEQAVKYAVMDAPSFGGFVLVNYLNDQMAGVAVINKTGMKGYIPENILVYIAVNKNRRGKGVGKDLMEKALDGSEGNVALHVEADNPAVKLYEKIGFTNKYLEMRYSK